MFSITKTQNYEKKENHQNLIERAATEVAGFAEMYSLLEKKVSLAGKSQSTLRSYGTHLAKLALHFGRVPTEIDADQINDYLYLVQ